MNTNSLYLCGLADHKIIVLDTGSDLNNPANATISWANVATITCNTDELQLFGTVIRGVALEKLRAVLFDSQLLVNREGYQVGYHNSDGSKSMSVGRSFLSKLNNLFGWSSYGVNPSIATIWNRYDNGSNKVVVDFEELDGRAKRLGKELEEQSEELKGCELKLADKEEILSHYKQIVEEGKEVMKEKSKVVAEKENLIVLLVELLDEKNRVIQEQRTMIEQKIAEIQVLKKMTIMG
ncbi:hypothetical protein LINGRAHAP2_LOCUS8568 [Linum grandiflorum]